MVGWSPMHRGIGRGCRRDFAITVRRRGHERALLRRDVVLWVLGIDEVVVVVAAAAGTVAVGRIARKGLPRVHSWSYPPNTVWHTQIRRNRHWYKIGSGMVARSKS